MTRYVTANLDFVRGGTGDYVDYLTSLGDVLLVQEAKTTVLDEVLPAGWVSLQHTNGEGRMGSAIAVRDSVRVLEHGLVLGCKPFIRGRRVKMLTRWLAWADLEQGGTRWRVVACHAPPARFSLLRPVFLFNLRKLVGATSLAVVVGADANMPIARFARRVGCVGYGDGIIGLAVTSPSVVTGLDVDEHGMHRNWTDHPAVVADVAPLRLNRRQTGRYIGRLRKRLTKAGRPLP